MPNRITQWGEHNFGNGPERHVNVDWDNGRGLCLVMPPDRARVVSDE